MTTIKWIKFYNDNDHDTKLCTKYLKSMMYNANINYKEHVFSVINISKVLVFALRIGCIDPE